MEIRSVRLQVWVERLLAFIYPNSICFGLEVLPIYVHWGQSIHYLGTGTLIRVGCMVECLDGGGSRAMCVLMIPGSLQAAFEDTRRAL